MQSHLSDPAQRVRPHLPLPLAQLNHNVAIDPPPLISAYLRMGAKVLGPPSWDPHFNTADLPIMATLSDLPPRFRKYFLGE
jgi:putative hemolysin